MIALKRIKKSGPGARPHVALLVESSLASGRDILRGIARYGREHEPWSLYYEPRGLEESVPRWLRHWRGDGIIARIQNQSIAREVRATGLPVVDVLGVVPDAGVPLVHVDDCKIARLAAAHLHERGFREFGFFGIEGENWSERRREAFVETVRQAGSEARIYELPRGGGGGASWEKMEDILARWIAGIGKPAGVMVCSDQRGPQFLEACRRAGVRVPDEVAVIGVDDDEALCEVCNPPLSSVKAGHVQVGYEAAALLDRIMSGRAVPDQPMLVAPQGITTRLSSDVLAIEDRPVAEVLRLIREHACSGIKVETLARQAGLSRSVLQRRFRTALGRSVHQEIVNARLKRAMDLLVTTDLTLADIAERSGFKYQEYLGAVFKQRLHKTPVQYRREASY